ncbi:cathepsin L [Aphelenchoides avenae]|nr:cathepsin L [Aphelenchus avenae]
MAQLFLVLVASVYVALSHGSPTFEHRHAVYGKVLCHNEYSAWKSYQARTDRIVSTASKEARLAAFLANLKMIQEHNEAYERGETSFKMGLHSRSDWPQWEMALLNGLKPSDPSAQQDTRPFTPPKNADVPKSIDWRSRGAVTGVKDQGYNGSACGACWAFGTVGAVEAAHFIKTGKLVSLSVQNLVDCATPAQGYPGESGCGGSNTTSEPFKYVVDHGLESEDDYPYREIPKQIVRVFTSQHGTLRKYTYQGCPISISGNGNGSK